MDTLRLKLIQAGQTIKDSDYLTIFMSTLPDEFDHMATMINYKEETVDTMVSKLREIEMRKAVRPGFAEASAFTTQTQRGFRGSRFPQRGPWHRL